MPSTTTTRPRKRDVFERTSLAETVRALRKNLKSVGLNNDERDDPPPKRLRFGWCTPRQRMLGGETLVDAITAMSEGCVMALLLVDQRVIVGDILRDAMWRGSILIRLWGKQQPTRVPRSSILSLRAVSEHSLTEERLVRERQARSDWLTFAELRELGGLSDAST